MKQDKQVENKESCEYHKRAGGVEFCVHKGNDSSECSVITCPILNFDEDADEEYRGG